MKNLLIAVILLGAACGVGRGAVASYGDQGITPTSLVYAVKVNGQPVYVHNYWDAHGPKTQTGIKYLHYAHFGATRADYDAGLTVEVSYHTLTGTPVNIVPADTRVSPQAYGITTNISGNKLTFTLHDPKKLFVAINMPLVPDMKTQHKTHFLLMLFPDLAEAIPSGPGVYTMPNGSSVAAINTAIANVANHTVVLPAGTYQGRVLIKRSNVTLYLAPGAYVRSPSRKDDATVLTDQAIKIARPDASDPPLQNVQLKGRGVIEAWSQVVAVEDCENMLVEGVIMRSTGRQWTGRPDNLLSGLAFWPHRMNHSVIRNIKVLRYPSTPRTGDGIDPDSCHHTVVEDNIVFSGDDAYCFKANEAPVAAIHHNILRNNVGVTPTSAFKYGVNYRSEHIHDELWHDNHGVYGGIQIDGDANQPSSQSNIVIRDIIIENSFRCFLSVGVALIDVPHNIGVDLTLENITVNKTWPDETPIYALNPGSGNVALKGYCGVYLKAKTGKTVNVTFKNLVIEGTHITSLDQLRALMNNHLIIGGPGGSDHINDGDRTDDDGVVNVYFNNGPKPTPRAP